MSPAHKTRQRTPAKPLFCFCCCAPAPRRSEYCPRCKRFLKQDEKRIKALALKDAWDPIAKGFRCYYTGVLLDTQDSTSPWFLTFDHRIPRSKGNIVVCAAWVNIMKNRLTDEEFRAVIIEFARSKETKEPFNMAVAEFKYWNGWKLEKIGKPAKLTDRNLPEFGSCRICSAKTYPFSPYCPICRNIIRGPNNRREHEAAMVNAWDPRKKAFICYLTGLKLELEDISDPLFRTFDHGTPGRLETLKMAAAFANVMKTALSEEEFWLVVKELAHHFQTGEAFSKDVVGFAYWKGWVIAQRNAMRAKKLAAKAGRR